MTVRKTSSIKILPTMKGIEAYRMMDTVVAQNLVMTTTCKHADIVLPVTSPWERYGDVTKGMRESLLWFSQVVDPLFECKSDAEIAAELADRIGVDRQVLQPKTEKPDGYRFGGRSSSHQGGWNRLRESRKYY